MCNANTLVRLFADKRHISVYHTRILFVSDTSFTCAFPHIMHPSASLLPCVAQLVCNEVATLEFVTGIILSWQARFQLRMSAVAAEASLYQRPPKPSYQIWIWYLDLRDAVAAKLMSRLKCSLELGYRMRIAALRPHPDFPNHRRPGRRPVCPIFNSHRRFSSRILESNHIYQLYVEYRKPG